MPPVEPLKDPLQAMDQAANANAQTRQSARDSANDLAAEVHEGAGQAQVEEAEAEAEEFTYQPMQILPRTIVTQVDGTSNEYDSLGFSATPTAAYPTPLASPHASMVNNYKGQDREADERWIMALCESSRNGNLQDLQEIIADIPQNRRFTLVNSAHPHSSLYALHYAAARGHLHICSFLVNSCGAMLLEDTSGETAVHVAAYKGNASILRLLIDASSESPLEAAQAADSDGWTALHNACSRGWLDIVKYLVQDVGVDINVRSKLGYTPLMNAASKGNLPVVNFLLSQENARLDPYKRNNYGETAYDVSATAEFHIAQVLLAAEAHSWREHLERDILSDVGDFNPLAVHISFAIHLHENQRLDLRIASLSKTPPQFSSSAIVKSDARSPFTLPPSYQGINPSAHHLPVFRSDLGLPTVDNPFQISLPAIAISYLSQQQQRSRKRTESGSSQRIPNLRTRSASSVSTADNSSFYASDALVPNVAPVSAERSHFWISDWFVDLTSPSVDASEGWQYAQSFDAPPEEWTADIPADLQRVLNQTTSNMTLSNAQTKWVRRRSWVRVMRRRLDRPPLPIADLDGPPISALIAAMPGSPASPADSPITGSTSDYLARARFKAGVHHKLGRLPKEADGASIRSGQTLTAHSSARGSHSRLEGRRLLARLESAVSELRIGLLSDEDQDRIQQASALLETYVSRLEEVRKELPPEQEEPDQFEQRGGSSSTSLLSVRQADEGQSDYFSRSVSQSAGQPDLTPDLSQATHFRVPANDSPMKARRTSGIVPTAISTLPVWENDNTTDECRRCHQPFTLFKRKHHCRRCGKICCNACSSNYDLLNATDIVTDPLSHDHVNVNAPQRTCNPCHAEISQPSVQHSGAFSEGLPLDSDLLSTVMTPLSTPGSPLATSEASSQVSVLSECPVCGFALGALGNQADQEEHVRKCLEGGRTSLATTSRYLVFKLGPSPLVGQDCEVCFEPFEVGSAIARLPCFCFYHKTCLVAWLNRGGNCPVHGRD